MKVTFWGTRGSLATPGPETSRFGGNTSCVEVLGSDGTMLILDAGSGLRRLSSAMPSGLRRVDLLLTHLHIDHILGLGFFSPFYNPEMEVHLWGPESPTMGLRTRLNRYLSPPLFPVHLRDLPCSLHLHPCPARGERIGEFLVEAWMICHPGLTVGYRITSADGVLAYLPDHEPALAGDFRRKVPAWTSGYGCAHGATLLIHDAQYSPEEYEDRVGWGHSTLPDTIAYGEVCDAKNLVLFHHDPSHDDETLERLSRYYIEKARSVVPVSAAEENRSFVIENFSARPV